MYRLRAGANLPMEPVSVLSVPTGLRGKSLTSTRDHHNEVTCSAKPEEILATLKNENLLSAEEHRTISAILHQDMLAHLHPTAHGYRQACR